MTEKALERESLAQMLRDAGSKVVNGITVAPNLYDESEIKKALDDGLTRDDIEWNQRLDRPWIFHPTDRGTEAKARDAWFIDNGAAHLARSRSVS